MKRMHKAFGVAAAASTVATLSPAPAHAASGSVIVNPSSTGLVVYGGIATGADVHVTSFGDATRVVVDTNVAILEYVPNCTTMASGDAVRPNRAVCTGITGPKIEVSGGAGADRLWVEVPGHWSDVSGGVGDDTLIGSRYARDVMNGGRNRDTITISHSGDANVDSANCGTVDGVADAAADTVNYNGSDTLSFCNGLDTKNFSTK